MENNNDRRKNWSSEVPKTQDETSKKWRELEEDLDPGSLFVLWEQ